jgi:riboflavin kinase / FMN adenylyltransferase
MLVVHGFQDVPKAAREAVLAIGNFDGVHRGHQALLATTKALAAGTRPHGVIIFDPHPRKLFQPTAPLFEITPQSSKLDLLARYGATMTVVLPFDQALAARDASAFIADVLVNGLSVHHVVVGYDFHFGRGRTGTPETLSQSASQGQFGLTVLEPVKAFATDGAIVASSSAVRAALARGAVADAATLLGHWWRASGVVTGGAKRGTGMGYPTANITLPEGCNLAHGIYAARVYIDGNAHAGAAYLGTRPTFDNGNPVLETYLLDFTGDLYGKVIDIEFIARVRPDQAFPDMPALVQQMDRDVAATRAHLTTLTKTDLYRWPDRPSDRPSDRPNDRSNDRPKPHDQKN